MTYEPYRPGLRSRIQDGPSWWEKSGKDMAVVLALCCFTVSVFAATALAVSSRSDEWGQWCADQGGVVQPWSRTPPDQRHHSGDDRYFCLVDGRAVGSR